VMSRADVSLVVTISRALSRNVAQCGARKSPQKVAVCVLRKHGLDILSGNVDSDSNI
jgi:hypothetical protein